MPQAQAIPELVPLAPAPIEPGPAEVQIVTVRDAVSPTPKVGLLRRLWRWTWSAIDWLFGLASLIAGLAALATMPLVQMLTLGYLLEAGGRMLRTGHYTAGMIGIRQASRAGSVVLGAWLMLLPVRAVSSLAASAQLIEPNSAAARGWTIALGVLAVLMVVHIASACWRGGRLRHFFWPAPVRTCKFLFRLATFQGVYTEARDAVCDFLERLRLPYYFWLGLRGFIGGLLWLLVPVTLLAAREKAPALSVIGGILFAMTLLYLPFLQARFAAENRFRAMFEVGEVRQLFRRAPWAFALALLATLSLALPLYLLKIQMIPPQTAWVESLVFIVFLFPARVLTGAACTYASRRTRPRNFFSRQLARVAMVPVVATYVGIVYLTQYTSWNGIASLYQQHAFLLPVPFWTFQ
jgi:hypothetical protein